MGQTHRDESKRQVYTVRSRLGDFVARGQEIKPNHKRTKGQLGKIDLLFMKQSN